MREIRQHRRRLGLWFAALAAITLVPAVMAAVVVATAHLGVLATGTAGWRFIELLIFAHGMICYVAGAYFGDRVIGAEYRGRTLPELLLLPQGPARLLIRKLAFPLCGVTLLWAAGIPGYVLMVVLGFGSFSLVMAAAMLPLLVGSAAVIATLGLPPHLLAPAHMVRRRTGIAGLVGWLNGFVLALPMLLAYSLLWRRPVLMGVHVPQAVVVLGITGVLALLGWGTACGVLAFPRELAWASGARRVAFGAIVLVVAGFYARMEPGVVLLMAAFGVVSQPLGLLRQSEDPRTAREIAWIESRWRNPLFIRDLRAYTRRLAPSSYLALVAAAVLVTAGVSGWLIARVPPAARPSVGPIIVLGAAPAFLALVRGAGWVAALWAKEHTKGTLALLLLTPQTSRELLAGRFAAGLLGTLLVGDMAIPLGLAALAWALMFRLWPAVPLALGLPSLVVLMASTARVLPPPTTAEAGLPRDALVPLCCSLSGVAALALGTLTAWRLRLSLGPSVALGLGLAVLNFAAARYCFGIQVRRLEELRAG